MLKFGIGERKELHPPQPLVPRVCPSQREGGKWKVGRRIETNYRKAEYVTL
jgi:hypothetical protein